MMEYYRGNLPLIQEYVKHLCHLASTINDDDILRDKLGTVSLPKYHRLAIYEMYKNQTQKVFVNRFLRLAIKYSNPVLNSMLVGVTSPTVDSGNMLYSVICCQPDTLNILKQCITLPSHFDSMSDADKYGVMHKLWIEKYGH